MDSNSKNDILFDATGRQHTVTFQKLELIAKGGMAMVYRGVQPSLNRFIAIKKIKDEYLDNPEVRERFRREAKTLASVLHQNVAHVYDFVEDNSEPYLVMEYIDGMDLSFVLEKVNNLPPIVTAAIALQIAKGLSFIHANQLIHRDIKPANIRITTRGTVKLMDFGIVMNLEDEGLTRPGVMVGSPSYLSPEQVLGDSVTAASDIFLLGIVLYEMLTGTKPFKDDGKHSVYQQIREADFLPIKKLNPRVPKSLAKIVERCLQKEPHHRFSSAKQIIFALENTLGHFKREGESIILKYLEEEALLSASVVYDFSPAVKIKKWKLSWVFALILSAATFGAGFWWGSAHKNFAKTSPSNYPAPQNIKSR